MSVCKEQLGFLEKALGMGFCPQVLCWRRRPHRELGFRWSCTPGWPSSLDQRPGTSGLRHPGGQWEGPVRGPARRLTQTELWGWEGYVGGHVEPCLMGDRSLGQRRSPRLPRATGRSLPLRTSLLPSVKGSVQNGGRGLRSFLVGGETCAVADAPDGGARAPP